MDSLIEEYNQLLVNSPEENPPMENTSAETEAQKRQELINELSDKFRDENGRDLYDYQEVKYKKEDAYVTIFCIKCFVPFFQWPRYLRRRRGCANCFANKHGVSDQTQEWIETAIEIHGAAYDYSWVDYINNRVHVTIFCNTCYTTFPQTPSSHTKKKDPHGCASCATKLYQIEYLRNYIAARPDMEKAKNSDTTRDYIAQASKRHQDAEYDYSSVIVFNDTIPVIIKCSKGHVFAVKPQKHLTEGIGCRFCKMAKTNKEKPKDENAPKFNVRNTIAFMEKSNWIHSGAFDYRKVMYDGKYKEVEIKCNACGLEFKQTPFNHYRAKGCPAVCHLMLTLEEFIERACDYFGGHRYGYAGSKYTGSRNPIEIFCYKCDSYFWQMAAHHMQGQGCPTCSYLSKHSTREQFIEKAKTIHKDKYNYDAVVYKNNCEEVSIFCLICQAFFQQTPNNHLSGKGCSSFICNPHKALTSEKFQERAKAIHGEQYNYQYVIYVKADKDVIILCSDCEKTFEQRPDGHLRGAGCPHCRPNVYSKISIVFLQLLGERLGKDIQHAENRGEKTIPGNDGRRFKVDGYWEDEEEKDEDKRKKIVYEFLGNFWHGNPDIYKGGKENDTHPRIGKTYAKLHEETMARLERIQDLGHDVFYIWEKDFYKYQRQANQEGSKDLLSYIKQL